MKSKKLIFILTLFLIINTMETNAQVTGKKYEAETSYVCKKMVDGGCVIVTYCVLDFKTETVEVSYYTKVNCTPKEKEAKYKKGDKEEKQTYPWSEINKRIVIEGFKEFGTFEWKDAKLVGKKNETDDLEFSEKKR